MAATPFYAWEKAFFAVDTLASGSGSLRERLQDAYWSYLHSLVGHPLPWDDLRKKFEGICETLVPEISDGPEATRDLSDDYLRALAHEIVSLYDKIGERYYVSINARDRMP